MAAFAAIAALPSAQAFVHPGVDIDQSDINRMKTQVAAGAHPWIDDWNLLIASSYAKSTWIPNPVDTVTRGCSSVCVNNYSSCMVDAAAAYQNALEWLVTGNTAYADCAVNILNQWQYTLTTLDPCCTDELLLAGIQGYQYALAGELMRNYSGWAASDFANYQSWMMTVWYPSLSGFLANHNGSCISHYWANWDTCAMKAILAIGVLADNQSMFNEALNYFYRGAGNGSLANAVFYRFGPGAGQWQESGRDQGHTKLGVGHMTEFLETAWKQGIDLYGYTDPASGKMFFDGSEYVANYNLGINVPYTTYNNCDNVNQTGISSGGRGIGGTYWDETYEGFLRRGMISPYAQTMAYATRPASGPNGSVCCPSWAFDDIGFSTLTHYVGSAPAGVPITPLGMTGSPGINQANLSWVGCVGASSYTVLRAAASGGPYTAIGTSTTNSYTDTGLVNGTTYYYVVSATNLYGTSANSSQVAVTPQCFVPAAPSGVSSIAGPGQATLNWPAVTYANSYNINRATVSGGPYTTIGTSTTAGYTDSSLINGTTYYYVVSSSGTCGTSGNSSQVSATPQASFGVFSYDGDIGPVGIPGSASVSGGTYTISGGGADIWGSSDAFNYCFKPISGNYTITARVASVQNTNVWAKVGVMIRESTAANASFVHVFVTPSNGVLLGYRNGTGGSVVQTGQITGIVAPYWVRLARSGNTFTGYASPDGVTWTQLSSVTVSMATSADVGLDVCAHNNTALCTSTFDNVTAP